MKSKGIAILILLSVLLLGFSVPDRNEDLFSIPARSIEPYKILGDSSNQFSMNVTDFEISPFVTYAEYKVYLAEVQKDSSSAYYKSQLPDSTMCLPDNYKKYVGSTKYDNYPVLGISWDAAMNYCRWMTLKNNKDSVRYIYCLPSCSQWLSAYAYLKSKDTPNDFNRDYSDWLVSMYDETYREPASFYKNKFVYDDTYWATKSDPVVLKRKRMIGASYVYTCSKLSDYCSFGYYSFHGYRQIGFRYVKCKIEGFSIEKSLLKYWGLNKKLK